MSQERALRIIYRDYESPYEDLISAAEALTMLTKRLRYSERVEHQSLMCTKLILDCLEHFLFDSSGAWNSILLETV